MERIKKRVALFLTFTMILSLVAPISLISFAVSKPKISSKTVNITVGKKKTIKVSSSVKGKVYVRSLNNVMAKVTSYKKTVKKGKPASFTVKGLYPGYAIIAIKVKTKKKIKGKKEFDLRCHVYVKEKPSPTPSATPSLKPSMTPTATPSRTPSASPSFTPSTTPSASPSLTPSASPSATPSATSSATPTVTPSPTPRVTQTPGPTADPDNYTVTYKHNLSSDKIVTGMPNPLVVKVPKNGNHKLILPPAPSYPGYYFDAWIYDRDYRKSPGTEVNIYKDMVIEAYLRRDSSQGYIVQYETGGQTNPDIRGVVNGVLVPYGGTLTISSIVPSWNGHTFSGWYLRGYESVLYQPGQTIENISSSLTFYAAWDV